MPSLLMLNFSDVFKAFVLGGAIEPAITAERVAASMRPGANPRSPAASLYLASTRSARALLGQKARAARAASKTMKIEHKATRRLLMLELNRAPCMNQT